MAQATNAITNPSPEKRSGRKRTVLRMALVVLILLLLPVVSIGSPLLQNGGFEEDFHHQPGISGEVADGWVAYNEVGNPTYLGTSTFAGGGWVEKIEGSDSHIILAEDLYPKGLPFTAVLFQQVNGVAPGTAYSASGWFLSMWGGSAGDDPIDPYSIGKKIGIDPAGGTDPASPNVVWSVERWEDKSFVNPGVAARASGTTLTVFVRIWSKWQQSANQAIVDGFRLEEAPTAAMDVLPTFSQSPITVGWSGNLPAGLQALGNFALFYDLEVQDNGGAWQPWLTKTRDTSATYVGQPGHTYGFRVRPYAIQPKGEPPQYWPPSTFPGLPSDSVATTVDGAPPSSAVSALPRVQATAPFMVAWTGTDDSTGIAGYTVQYRVGNGAWTDWLTDVTYSSALFGQGDRPVPLVAGQTYALRSRARDGVGRLETYPATPDATTVLAAHLLSGMVRDLRYRPVAGATVTLSPTHDGLSEATTGALGEYLAGVAASGTYSVTAAHSGFGPALPRRVLLDDDRAGFELFLPPPSDAIANGSFETGDLTGWQAAGSSADSTAFTGDWAGRLGPGSTAHLSQTITVPIGIDRLTLSFMYRPAGPATISDALRLRVAGTEQTVPLAVTDWTHFFVDMEPLVVPDQPTSVEFIFEPAGTSSFGVLVDDVWLGSAPPPPQVVFLPFLTRQGSFGVTVAGSPIPEENRSHLARFDAPPPLPPLSSQLAPQRRADQSWLSYLPMMTSDVLGGMHTPSPTATPAATASATPAATASATPTATASATPTATASATPTATASATPTATASATPTATASATPTATASATPTATPDWLTHANSYRALADLPPLTENASWSDGDWKHARYMVKNDAMGHTEDPANPWYTVEGAQAGQSSNVMVSTSTATTDLFAIDLWMRGPFHAVGIIDPALAQAGFGSYREASGIFQMAAALDVIRGLGTVPVTVTFPVYFPSNGGVLPILAYTGGETPNPLSSCAGYTPYTGPPIILQIGDGGLTPQVTDFGFWHAGTSLEVCEFDETNYTDPVYQATGRSILGVRDAIVLMPRYPLTAGETYSATITNNADVYTWSFSVASDATTSAEVTGQIR